jgi:hypothetical protein
MQLSEYIEVLYNQRRRHSTLGHPWESHESGIMKTLVSHTSSNSPMNSRAPRGPVSSRKTGPPSGSTVVRNRRKRQQ